MEVEGTTVRSVASPECWGAHPSSWDSQGLFSIKGMWGLLGGAGISDKCWELGHNMADWVYLPGT